PEEEEQQGEETQRDLEGMRSTPPAKSRWIVGREGRDGQGREEAQQHEGHGNRPCDGEDGRPERGRGAEAREHARPGGQAAAPVRGRVRRTPGSIPGPRVLGASGGDSARSRTAGATRRRASPVKVMTSYPPTNPRAIPKARPARVSGPVTGRRTM